MNVFDEIARLATKINGVGFHAWLRRRKKGLADLVFTRWADARRLAMIPGLERIDDVVAVLHPIGQPEKETYLITELETKPRRHLFKRLGIYVLLLSIEVSVGTGPETEPPVVVCVLCL